MINLTQSNLIGPQVKNIGLSLPPDQWGKIPKQLAVPLLMTSRSSAPANEIQASSVPAMNDPGFGGHRLAFHSTPQGWGL